MYTKIREKILEYPHLFRVIHFFFTPVRVIKEFFARRQMANVLIERYQALDSSTRKIFYFGIPEHNNLGDMAQTYCTRRWISEQYPDYHVVEVRTRASFDRKFLNFMKQVIHEDDILLFQSGYCTRKNNPDHLMHLNILKYFPNHRAVILPQTVKLDCPKEIKRTKSVFSQCTRLLFIARDHISHEKAKQFVSDKHLALFPDIVTSLIGKREIAETRKGVLFCIRNDDEKYYSDSEINDTMRALNKVTDTVDITDTNSHLEVTETYKNLERIILEKIRNFGKYQVVITDRYHGTIFSLIANTPVIIIKTNDHKVTSGAVWFDGVFDQHAIQVANDLNEAQKLAKEILEQRFEVTNGDYFNKEYYAEKLKNFIESY